MQKLFARACACTSINPKIFRSPEKNSHPLICCHTTLDAPAPPQSMLLTGPCRHPNGNGCFFWRLCQAKLCNNIESGGWGVGKILWRDGCRMAVFLKNPVCPKFIPETNGWMVLNCVYNARKGYKITHLNQFDLHLYVFVHVCLILWLLIVKILCWSRQLKWTKFQQRPRGAFIVFTYFLLR